MTRRGGGTNIFATQGGGDKLFYTERGDKHFYTERGGQTFHTERRGDKHFMLKMLGVMVMSMGRRRM